MGNADGCGPYAAGCRAGLRRLADARRNCEIRAIGKYVAKDEPRILMPSTNQATVETEKRRRETPRPPVRGRGVARYAALLDAAHELLQREDPSKVGLYQIAEQAGVPGPSAYHFFPTKEAAYVALAERYVREVLAVHAAPIEARLIHSWQDLYVIDNRRAMEYFNNNPAAAKIMYGNYGGAQAREIDRIFNRKLARGSYGRLNKLFYMPYMSDPERVFEINLAILDGIWEVSVRREGYVTEAYMDETDRACFAYLRLFLPDRIDLREALKVAQARGEHLLMHLPGDALETTADPRHRDPPGEL